MDRTVRVFKNFIFYLHVKEKSLPHTSFNFNTNTSTFGEGVSAGFDHVVLVGKGAEAADRITPIERQMIEDYWDEDEIYEGSRLASAIVLKREMDGMAVYVPDRLCEDIP
jgi:hypothetical protein